MIGGFRCYAASAERTVRFLYYPTGLEPVVDVAGVYRLRPSTVGGDRLLQVREQRFRFLKVARVEAFGEPGVERGEEGAGGVAFALALPEPRQAGGGAQLERLGLLASRDLQGLAEERLCLLDRVAVQFMISAEVPRWRRYISVAQANARWPASDA